jgi:hypothetical protein
MHDEKILWQLPIVEYFFIVIFNFSLVKAAMNALHLCKLRTDCLSGIDHGSIVLTKRLALFLHFPVAKGGTKTIAQIFPEKLGVSIGSISLDSSFKQRE